VPVLEDGSAAEPKGTRAAMAGEVVAMLSEELTRVPGAVSRSSVSRFVVPPDEVPDLRDGRDLGRLGLAEPPFEVLARAVPLIEPDAPLPLDGYGSDVRRDRVKDLIVHVALQAATERPAVRGSKRRLPAHDQGRAGVA
jgi:hypothetical protein